MRRREFMALLGASTAWPLAARAQEEQKVHRVGMLETTPATRNPNIDAFRNALKDLGYIEGRNLSIEYRSAEGRSERFPDLAAEILRLSPDDAYHGRPPTY